MSEKHKHNDKQGAPLGSIPGLGYLFRNTSQGKTKTELNFDYKTQFMADPQLL